MKHEKLGNVSTFLSRYSRFGLLILIFAAMSFASKRFLTSGNIMNIFRQSSLYLIMSLGLLFAMLFGRGVDMSFGATLALTSCLAAQFMQDHPTDPAYVIGGVLIALVLSALIGALNGALIGYLRLPAILVTLGTRQIIRGIAYYFMSDKVITRMPKFIKFIGTGRVGGIPMPVIISAAFLLLTIFILRYTALGRRVYLVGANAVAARYSGIDSNRSIIFGFTMSSVFAGVAGLIYIGRLSAAEPSIGADFSFQCVSALAIGGVSFNGGIGSPLCAVVGAMVLSLILNAINLLSISAYWQGAINGVVVIAAVLIDYFARKSIR